MSSIHSMKSFFSLLSGFSKDLEDLDLSCTAPWGSVVEGVDEGAWIRVSDELYLPKELGGVPVLTHEESKG